MTDVNPQINYYNTQEEVRAAWRRLVLNDGYHLYADGDGGLHALRIGAGGVPE